MTPPLLQKILKISTRPYVTDGELQLLMNGTADSRYGKIKRWLLKGYLVHIRRGLYYIQGDVEAEKNVDLFELAQYIYGPSFISLESALSYYQLIPETVYTTTCVTSKRKKEFETPLGLFHYSRVPNKDLYSGVTLVKNKNSQFFIAKPWRAICDYIHCYRKDWDNLSPLVDSLRLDIQNLPPLRSEEFLILSEYYQSQRVHRFLKNCLNDLLDWEKR